MLEKRVYHIGINENGVYKVSSKGLLKSIQIIKNGYDVLPTNIDLYINNKLIDISRNDQNNSLYFDFSHIIDQILNYDEELEFSFDPHVMRMIIMSSNTRAIPHYNHLPLENINRAIFSHEMDIEFKVNDFILPKELKIEEEFYIPTFKLNKNKEEEN
jgi:hypothetical protein